MDKISLLDGKRCILAPKKRILTSIIIMMVLEIQMVLDQMSFQNLTEKFLAKVLNMFTLIKPKKTITKTRMTTCSLTASPIFSKLEKSGEKYFQV